MDKYLIYCLKDPTTLEIKYVGQTRRGIRRKYEHRSKSIRIEISHVNNWLNLLNRENLKPIFEILEVVNSPKELNDREKYWIKFYKETNDLLNLTDGGDNFEITLNHNSKFTKGKHIEDYYGFERAKEIRDKISKSTSGKNNPAFGSVNITPDYIKKQITSNSKKPLFVIDTVDNKTYKFTNSKEAAKFIGCSQSTIREGKRNGWKIKKRYLIQDQE